jgi:hypothetical protein
MEMVSFPPSTSLLNMHTGPSPEFRERTQIRLPSPREAVGSRRAKLALRGWGWGVAPRVPMQGFKHAGTAASLNAALPPTPQPLPATRKGAWVEGSSRAMLARPGRRILFSDSNFKQRICVRILAARFRPSFACRCPSKEEGAGNAGCALHPRSRAQRCAKESAHEHTGSAEAIRHSLRNGFTAYFALSPENRALLSPSPANSRLVRAR